VSKVNLIQPCWDAPENVKSFSTTRTGGYSGGLYNGLNLGLHVGDVPERVNKNRALLPNYQNITWLNQTHSADIVKLYEKSLVPLNADASYTSRAEQVCAVMTADCLPILLCNIEGSEVAAVHAGWRGLASGIVENIVGAMDSDPEQLIAWLGPAIGAESFEVGEDVFCCFSVSEKKAFYKSPFKGKYWLDLCRLASSKLGALGVHNVAQEEQCTYTSDDFFSYRRDGLTGRMASGIWIEG
jgi:YfiH family protein